MTIQVVAGTQSREFLLATLDHKIEQTRCPVAGPATTPDKPSPTTPPSLSRWPWRGCKP